MLKGSSMDQAQWLLPLLFDLIAIELSKETI